MEVRLKICDWDLLQRFALWCISKTFYRTIRPVIRSELMFPSTNNINWRQWGWSERKCIDRLLLCFTFSYWSARFHFFTPISLAKPLFAQHASHYFMSFWKRGVDVTATVLWKFSYRSDVSRLVGVGLPFQRIVCFESRVPLIWNTRCTTVFISYNIKNEWCIIFFILLQLYERFQFYGIMFARVTE